MKKSNVIQITTMLIAFILLTSCGTKFSITKRHYQKGYYFTSSKSKTNHPDEQKRTAFKTHSKGISEYQTALVSTESNNLQSAQINLPTSGFAVVPKIETPTQINNKHQNPSSRTIPKTETIGSNFNQQRANPTLMPIAFMQQPAHKSDEGRSLFWIVIIVIVILWALGLISGGFGLGILINLLLLIALILLILWLLRIV